jgi:hypothetical protein
MPAGNYNMLCEQAATFNLKLTWLDENNAPIDITNYTADMKVVSGTDTVIELSDSNGRLTLGGATGVIQMTIAATDTANLPVGDFAYDLFLHSGIVATRLLQGFFTIAEAQTT